MEWAERSDVRSADGAPIAVWRAGSGPSLVVVHGSTSEAGTWLPAAQHLARSFTVHAVDRRGRGGSGDGAGHSLEREAEDVAAVLDAVGPAHLLGHSFGGLVALEAALLRPDALRSLVLYEPPLSNTTEVGIVDRLEALLAAGDREAALLTVYEEVSGMSAEDIAQLRASPSWERRIAIVPTVPREFRASRGYRFEPARIAALDVPAVLLVGTASQSWMKSSTETLAATLPRARVVSLEGQAHVAHLTAPELFARAVTGALA